MLGLNTLPSGVFPTVQLRTSHSTIRTFYSLGLLHSHSFTTLTTTLLHFEHESIFTLGLPISITLAFSFMTPPFTGLCMKAAGLGKIHKEIEAQKQERRESGKSSDYFPQKTEMGKTEAGRSGKSGTCCVVFSFWFACHRVPLSAP